MKSVTIFQSNLKINLTHQTLNPILPLTHKSPSKPSHTLPQIQPYIGLIHFPFSSSTLLLGSFILWLIPFEGEHWQVLPAIMSSLLRWTSPIYLVPDCCTCFAALALQLHSSILTYLQSNQIHLCPHDYVPSSLYSLRYEKYRLVFLVWLNTWESPGF